MQLTKRTHGGQRKVKRVIFLHDEGRKEGRVLESRLWNVKPTVAATRTRMQTRISCFIVVYFLAGGEELSMSMCRPGTAARVSS